MCLKKRCNWVDWSLPKSLSLSRWFNHFSRREKFLVELSHPIYDNLLVCNGRGMAKQRTKSSWYPLHFGFWLYNWMYFPLHPTELSKHGLLVYCHGFYKHEVHFVLWKPPQSNNCGSCSTKSKASSTVSVDLSNHHKNYSLLCQWYEHQSLLEFKFCSTWQCHSK